MIRPCIRLLVFAALLFAGCNFKPTTPSGPGPSAREFAELKAELQSTREQLVVAQREAEGLKKAKNELQSMKDQLAIAQREAEDLKKAIADEKQKQKTPVRPDDALVPLQVLILG